MAGMLKSFVLGVSLLCVTTMAQGGEIIRFGVQMTAETSFGRAAKDFARLVGEKSKGEIKVEVFTDGVLGDELEMWESLQLGTLDMCVNSPGRISNFVPEYFAFELPFIFRDFDHRDAVANGPVADKFNEILREKGEVVVLGQMGGSGRYLITRRTKAPDLKDIAGVKMRVQESQIVVDTWKALGTLPVTVAYAETYTALQTGVADAAENELSTFETMKWYEPCKFLMLTEHSIILRPILISEARFNRLSAAHQQILRECGLEAAELAVAYEREAEAKAFKTLEGFGIELVKLNNKQEWIDATGPIRNDFARKHGLEEVMKQLESSGK